MNHKTSTVTLLFPILIAAILIISWGCASLGVDRTREEKDLVQIQREGADRINRALVEEMRKGGLILYIRHTKTNWKEEDVEPFDYNDCSKQRNLSQEGREQAVKIGNTLKALKIPISEVRTSPLCRTVETAKLAFGEYVIDFDLADPPKQDEARREYLLDKLEDMLAKVPPTGKNLVYVSHASNMSHVFDFKPYPEGSIAVFRPYGNGSFEKLGIIKPDDLFRLE
jgi:phosphohistidine phosphatase SixA